MVLDGKGRYVVVLMRPDLPKFASNNRSTGTAEEYRAVALGSFTHCTYTVADSEIVFRLENTTFSNWDGQQQRRALTVTVDELKYAAISSIGGNLSRGVEALKLAVARSRAAGARSPARKRGKGSLAEIWRLLRVGSSFEAIAIRSDLEHRLHAALALAFAGPGRGI